MIRSRFFLAIKRPLCIASLSKAHLVRFGPRSNTHPFLSTSVLKETFYGLVPFDRDIMRLKVGRSIA